MSIKIKINSDDNLKLFKVNRTKIVLPTLKHKNKKNYSRLVKYKKTDF